MHPTADPQDVIVAVASAPGPAARGIVRASGQAVVDCVRHVFRPLDPGSPWSQHRACHAGHFWLHDLDIALPGTLYLWPTPRSYTRQPMAEWHTLGSPPLLQASVRALCQHGARLAEPGEFTLRAFLAGRMDLTQAEAVLGVIQARGSHQLDGALRQLAGGLRGPLDAVRHDLLDLVAELEAGLDFVEEDIEFITPEALRTRLAQGLATVEQIANQCSQRSVTSEAARVVLVGEPNVGKSSLFNAVCRRAKIPHQALVSEVAGTTRDCLIARGAWSGVPIEWVDTAGRETVNDALTIATQRYREQWIAGADLVVLCLDATRPLSLWEQVQLAEVSARDGLIALTKTDQQPATAGGPAIGQVPSIATSALADRGIDALTAAVAQRLAERIDRGTELLVGSTATRCGESLRLARDCLAQALELAATRGRDELIAAEVRMALDQLGRVLGATYTDDILDRIFSRFCIGK